MPFSEAKPGDAKRGTAVSIALRRRLFPAIVSALCLSAPAEAATVWFTDYSAWLAASGATSSAALTFNASTVDQYNGPTGAPAPDSGLNGISQLNFPGVVTGYAFDFSFARVAIDRDVYFSSAAGGSLFMGPPSEFNRDWQLTYTAGAIRNAAALYLVSGSDPNVNVYAFNQAGAVIGAFLMPISYSSPFFLGVVSDQPIWRLRADDEGDNVGGVGLRAVLTPVPVPAAVWLFGSALGLLGIARRRLAA